MKLATKKDIEAPIAKVWAALSDYEAWERSAMRRGVDVERTDKLTKPGPGMSWTSRFAYRARTRKADMKLTEMTGPGLLAFTLASDAVDVATKVELIEMSARRTRMHLTAEVKPRSLGARLFLQSLRLARAKVDRKFDAKVGQLALELETRAKVAK
ncbi:MAG: hypothetical protein RIT52_884 [Pseudomonadota bacterium]|jgi:uncharacterized protein YndB with AHSA1/START domain